MTKRRITSPDGSGEVDVDVENELPARERAANAEALSKRAEAVLDANRAFLAIANPTVAQTAAQVKALTRASSAILRLLLDRLESTD